MAYIHKDKHLQLYKESNLLMTKPPMERSVEASAIRGEGAEVVVVAVVVVVVILVIAYGRELDLVWG